MNSILKPIVFLIVFVLHKCLYYKLYAETNSILDCVDGQALLYDELHPETRSILDCVCVAETFILKKYMLKPILFLIDVEGTSLL